TAATLRLLSGLSQPIELNNLAADETEALLRSVFGDVRNLPLCAARIHGLSRGNPRAALELAQHLVDSGRARYEAGSWVLPSALDEADMPASLAASLSARVAELGADARELLDAMVLADGDMLAIQDFRDLTSHGDTRRVFAALDELASTRIVVLDGDRCDIAQRGFSSVVQQAMPEERRKLIHGRLADSLTTTGGDVLRRAHHLLAAGRDRRAIELLCSVDLAARMPPVQLLATAIDRADELGLPAATRHRLHMALLINAPFALASESFRKIAPIVLRQLDRDSGLARYRELAGLAPNERLSQALAQTHQAYLATPEHERVHSVIEAIGELVRVSGSLAAMASPVFDLELLETLPQVEPLLPLSPALQVASLLVSGAKDWVRGRVRLSYATYMKVLERVAEPDHAGLDDAQYDRIRLGLLYTVGLLEAASGLPAAERRAQSIENHRELRVNAWRMRSILQLALGNPDEARRCGRRAQLLQAQEGVRERYVGSAVGTELLGYARLGDMLGVKSVLDGLATLAADHPGWVPIELMGRALYAELQRDLEAALHLVEAALNASAQMPAQPYFAPIAARHLHILRELGQGDRACLLARVYVERAKAQQLNFYDLGLAAGLALARFGHYEEALPHVQLVIDEAEQVGRQGFALAAVYETRARIALWMNDRESFESYMDRCSRLHDPEKHPVIGALLARLVEEGRQHGMIPTEVAVSLRHSFRPSTVESEYETIHSRIAECVDLPDRARCALTLLLQNTVSSTGYLYGMGEDRSVQLLAALPDMPANDLDSWIAQYALETLEEEDSATGSASQSATGSARLAPLRYVDSEGRWYEAALLFDEIQQRRVLAAALVLQVDATHRTMPSPELRNRIAKELLEHGDVRGWR
ncbi:MAG TPA: hypothetical protein VJR89_21395, partial [Polyangiales bacterium]|nr:hypothetical protein [Polyangiales bacterium]